MENPNVNQNIGWDDTIEVDGEEYILLDEGDYNFIVTNFERGSFPGGAKIPPCNKASITVQVNSPKGLANVKFDLLLHRSVEWKLSAFFRCIGQKKPGEKLVMNWNSVIGSNGRAHFKPRQYTNQNGELREVNDLDRFIDYNETFFSDEDKLPF